MDQTTLTYIGILVGLVAILVTFWGVLEARASRIGALLDTPEGRARLLAQYSDGGDRWVVRSLDRFNAGTDQWFGSIGSRQQFRRCYQIAFAYPTLLFLLVWVFGGPGRLGTAPMLPEGLGLLPRLGYAVVIAVFAAAIFAYMHNWDRVLSRVKAVILRIASPFLQWGGHRGAPPQWVQGRTHWIAIALLFAVNYAFFSAIAAGAFAVVAAGAFAFVDVITVALISAVAVSFAGAVAVAFGFVSFDVTFALLFAGFLLFLPAVNAVLDHGSWTVTRIFMRSGQRHLAVGKHVWLAGEFLIDALCALLLLIALAFSLAFGVELLNHSLLDGDSRIDWGDHGWMAVLMLATTIIPTAVHLGVVVGAWITPRRWREQAINNLLKVLIDIKQRAEKGEKVSIKPDQLNRLQNSLVWNPTLTFLGIILVFLGFGGIAYAGFVWLPWVADLLAATADAGIHAARWIFG